MSDYFIKPILSNLGSPCYYTEQQRYADYMNKTIWKLGLGATAGLIVDPDEPSVEDRDKAWLKIGADGGLVVPVPLVYSTTYARWVGRHPKQAESGFNMELWMGTDIQLETYDGGNSMGVTPTTGPMWEVVTSMEDLIPIGIKTVIPTPMATAQVFDVSTPADPKLVGVHFIRRTAREYYTV